MKTKSLFIIFVFSLIFVSCKKTDVPTVTTNAISDSTLTTVTTGGSIASNGGSSIIAKGVCWSTIDNPTINDKKTLEGEGTEAFISKITDLQPGAIYFVRAYAINSEGVGYGQSIRFKTVSIKLPSVETIAISDSTLTTLATGGIVTADGGSQVLSRGICWNTSIDPTINNSKTTNGDGLGTFTSALNGLLPGTIYYIRAYATNSSGTGYGQTIIGKTVTIKLPTIQTLSTTYIGINNATAGFSLTSNGGGTVSAQGLCWSTNSTPTINDNKSTNNQMSGLSANTTYYYRAYSTNESGIGYGTTLSFKTCSVADADGNVYHEIKIGDQIWMVENLKTTKYNDGTSINFSSLGYEWISQTTGAYCWPLDNSSYKDIYGAFYNWYAVSSGKLAPNGWHIPTETDWLKLRDYLGGSAVAGGKMKENGTVHWNYPNTGATNESGFTALPAGYISTSDGSNKVMGAYSFFWSNSGTINSYGRLGLNSTSANFMYGTESSIFGFSVRCIKD